MSKSILTIDTPKGCVFCPLAKMHSFNAFHNYRILESKHSRLCSKIREELND